jgi:hypothetical protein
MYSEVNIQVQYWAGNNDMNIKMWWLQWMQLLNKEAKAELKRL